MLRLSLAGSVANPLSDGPARSVLLHRQGEKNGLLTLCREAGIYGKLAWEKTVPAYFFQPDTSADVVRI